MKGQTVVKLQRKHFSLLMLNKISITSEVFENFSTLYLLYLRGWSLNIDIIENFLGIGTVFVECTFIDYFIEESYKLKKTFKILPKFLCSIFSPSKFRWFSLWRSKKIFYSTSIYRLSILKKVILVSRILFEKLTAETES